MHPRQMKRAPHQRLSTADIRNLASASFPAPATPRPSCAFHARGVGATIQVARSFEVHFVVSGLSASFKAGTAVGLHRAEEWKGSDQIAIAVDKVWGTPDYCLVAVRKPDLDDNLRGFVVGGFDLDATGAVLAGSFWDANLDDDGEVCDAPATVATRMAETFVNRARDGFDDTTNRDLVREGFSEAEVMRHYDQATAIAAAQLRDADIGDTRTTYDRQARVMLGAIAVAGTLDPNTVNTTLHLAGLSTREIGNLFDDIVGEAMRLVREGHAALIGVH